LFIIIKFETILEEEKVIKTKKLVKRLKQRKEGIITTHDEILEAATREIIIVKG
jgi:hypothetical protein